jgi:hypothetical protein
MRKMEDDALQRASGVAAPTTPLPGVLPALRLTILQREPKNAPPRPPHQAPSTDPTSGIMTAPDSTNHPIPPSCGFGQRGRGRGRDRARHHRHRVRSSIRDGCLYHLSTDIGAFFTLCVSITPVGSDLGVLPYCMIIEEKVIRPLKCFLFYLRVPKHNAG